MGNEFEQLRSRLQALNGQKLLAVAAAAGVSRATAYRLRRRLSERTPAGTVARLKRALNEADGNTTAD